MKEILRKGLKHKPWTHILKYGELFLKHLVDETEGEKFAGKKKQRNMKKTKTNMKKTKTNMNNKSN